MYDSSGVFDYLVLLTYFKVVGLADLVNKQHDFLCRLNDRALLDMERRELVEAILAIVVIFASYARGEIVSALLCAFLMAPQMSIILF